MKPVYYQVLGMDGKCLMTTQEIRGEAVPCPVTIRHRPVPAGTVIEVLFMENVNNVVVLNTTQVMVMEEAC